MNKIAILHDSMHCLAIGQKRFEHKENQSNIKYDKKVSESSRLILIYRTWAINVRAITFHCSLFEDPCFISLENIWLFVGRYTIPEEKALFKSWNNTLYNSRSEWQPFPNGRPDRANPFLCSCSSDNITLCRGYHFGEISAEAWKSYHHPAEYPEGFRFIQ